MFLLNIFYVVSLEKRRSYLKVISRGYIHGLGIVVVGEREIRRCAG